MAQGKDDGQERNRNGEGNTCFLERGEHSEYDRGSCGSKSEEEEGLSLE